MAIRKSTTKEPQPGTELSDAKLGKMIAEATVDAHDKSEQIIGFFAMFEEILALPFETEMLGVKVTVERLDITDDDQIVAVCTRGKARQRVAIVDLPLPSPAPEGADWIAAYRRWAGGGR